MLTISVVYCNLQTSATVTITPVLKRLTEEVVVREHLYPALLSPPTDLTFTDQFAFRPIGSTTAALIFLLRTTELLSDNPYVICLLYTSPSPRDS